MVTKQIEPTFKSVIFTTKNHLKHLFNKEDLMMAINLEKGQKINLQKADGSSLQQIFLGVWR